MVLQRVTACCSAFQQCTTLQHTSTTHNTLYLEHTQQFEGAQRLYVCCSVLQCVAVCCSVLQMRCCSCVAVWCTLSTRNNLKRRSGFTILTTFMACDICRELELQLVAGVLQRDAVCCSMLQGCCRCVAGVLQVCCSEWTPPSWPAISVDSQNCSVVQCVAGVLQCAAVCCSILQRVTGVLQCTVVYCSVLQYAAGVLQVCCSVLQCAAVCCSVLQYAAGVLQVCCRCVASLLQVCYMCVAGVLQCVDNAVMADVCVYIEYQN